MQKNILGLVIAGVLLVGGAAYIVHLRTENERLKGTANAPAAAPVLARAADPNATAGRVLTAEQRQTLVAKLDIRGGATHSVWFATIPNNPEASNYQKQIQSAFEEAGWTVQSNRPVTFSLKPGVFFFVADEDPPAYVQSVADAFEAAGIQPQSGRGYRQFYLDKKKENPNWNGFELPADQDFIVVVGRKPDEPKPLQQ